MKTKKSFNGKIAVVTGASEGIGREIALRLNKVGCHLALIDINTEGLKKVKSILDKTNGTCTIHECDVSNSSSMIEIAKEINDLHGSVDILVNNAGASWGEPIDEYSEKGWDKVMDTNVKGVFFLTQKLLPLLRKSGTAEDPSRVINIGSIDGIKTGLFDAFSYGPSKAALHHLTRVLAASLVRENIIVNAIAPGPFPTWMLSTGVGGGGDIDIDWSEVGNSNPRGRVGTAEDIAGLAIFLSSRAGAYTVGQTITCDGGVVASS